MSEPNALDRSGLSSLPSTDDYEREFRALVVALMAEDKTRLAIELADCIVREKINSDIKAAFGPQTEAANRKAEQLRDVLENGLRERISGLEETVRYMLEESFRLKGAIEKAQKTHSIKPLQAVTSARRRGRPSIDLGAAKWFVDSVAGHRTSVGTQKAAVISWINAQYQSGGLDLSRRQDKRLVNEMTEYYRTCIRRVNRG